MHRWPERPPSGGGRWPRRGTDRLEDALAWVLIAVGLLVVVGAVFAGVRAGAEAAERVRIAQGERVRAEAVVVDVAAVPDAEPEAESADWVTVRYTDLAGRTREGALWLTGAPPVGTSVQVWVDRAGRLAPAVPGAHDAVVVGAIVGLGAAFTGGLLLVLAWLAVEAFVDKRNGAAWAREWEKVEPLWSGRRSTD